MRQQTKQHTVGASPQYKTDPQYVDVIRGKDGRVECIITGMSEDDIDRYLLSHPETYLSMAQYDERKGITI